MMPKLLMLFAVAVLLCAGQVQAQSLEEEQATVPKMPVYVGLGYNLATGNPLSNSVDTGFGYPIFKIGYKKNQKTSDNRYIVPDGVTHRVVSSCSFESAVTEHRGTQSYRKSILDKISSKEGIETSIFETSFSKSRSYETVHKLTI